MHPVLRLVRVGNVGVSFAGALVGGLAARGAGVSLPLGAWVTLALAAASTSLVTAGGNVLNDVGDLATDRVNHPDRPLVTGAISLGTARGMVVGLFLAGAVIVVPVIWVRPLVGVILLVAVSALLAYEFRFKAIGFAGNLTVALLTGLVLLYGGAAVGNVVLVLPFGAMAFLATLSREVIKDMEDMAGDVDRHTLPQRRGLGFASGAARAAVGTAIVLSPVPVLDLVRATSAVGIMYLGLVFVADALFVVSVAYLPRELHREQSMSKVAMTVALLAFLVVAFR